MFSCLVHLLPIFLTRCNFELEIQNAILRHFNLFFVDLMALIAKVIAVTPTTEVPVRAADTAENVSWAMETILNQFISVAFRKKNKNCFERCCK